MVASNAARPCLPAVLLLRTNGLVATLIPAPSVASANVAAAFDIKEI